MELISDYDMEIHYHPGKANIVADALSRKAQINMIVSHRMPQELGEQFDKLSLGFLNQTKGVTLDVEPTLEQDIRKGQKDDPRIKEIKQAIAAGRGKEVHEDADGVV